MYTVLRGLLRPISFEKPPAPAPAAVPAFSSSPGMLPYLGPSPGAVHLVGGHLRKGWLWATHPPLRLVMTSGGHSEGQLSDPWLPAPARGDGALSPVKAEHTEPGLAHGRQDLLSGRPELTPSPSPSQRVKSTAAPPPPPAPRWTQQTGSCTRHAGSEPLNVTALPGQRTERVAGPGILQESARRCGEGSL